METLEKKAAEMLQKSEVVVLTSINKEGYPRPVPMSMIKAEGISTVWMSTGDTSWKTEDFRKNPKGGLCFYAQGDSVCMTGDPTYVILKFKANHATYWIKGKFIHRKV